MRARRVHQRTQPRCSILYAQSPSVSYSVDLTSFTGSWNRERILHHPGPARHRHAM